MPQKQNAFVSAASPSRGLTPNNLFQPVTRDNPFGPLGNVIPGDIRQGDISAIEAGLNFQQNQNAITSQNTGNQMLRRGIGAVGQSRPSRVVTNQAIRAVRNPQLAQELGRARGALKSSGAVTARDMQSQLAQNLAAQGISGGIPAAAEAGLLERQATNLAARLGEFDTQSALASEQARQASMAQLAQIAQQQELMQAAFLQQIADNLVNTEFGQVDLSGIINRPEHAFQNVLLG